MTDREIGPAGRPTTAGAPTAPEGLGSGAGPDPGRPIVLMIAPTFPPDPLSGAARAGRFARYLPQFGYEPVVICLSAPDYPAGSATIRRVPAREPGRGARTLAGAAHLLQRFLLPYNDCLPWAVHAAAEAESVLSHRPVVAVLSSSPPAAAHLVALWLKRRHGLPWVADFRDPLLGNPFRSRRWFFPYDAWLERLLFRHADALVANTDTAAELWRGRYPGIEGKMTVLWNGFDPEDRVEAAPPEAGGRLVLAHVGSLYGARHPGRLLASLDRLIRGNRLDPERVLLRLVGPIDGACIERDRQVADSLRARGCLEYNGKKVPQEEARRASAQADYLLLLDLNEGGLDLQVPAKLFEYVRIGRPILTFTGRGSPVERILRGSGVPCRIVHHDAADDEVDRQVRGLFDLPVEPVPPSAWFEREFDGRDQARRLAGILDAVSGREVTPAAGAPRAMLPGGGVR